MNDEHRTVPSGPLPGRPSEGNAAADAADPYRKALAGEQRREAAPDGESTERAQEREQAALDNVREKYDVPVGAKPKQRTDVATPAPAPLPEGPNDLGRRNTTPT